MGQHRAIQASVESQQLLGRVAAGLNFTNKVGLAPAQRYKALIYAAHQLKDYYRFKRFPLPDTGQALTDPSDVVSQAVEANAASWREVWRQCSEFSGEHVYVLVAGAELPRNAGNLAALGRLPWSMVLDFGPMRPPSGYGNSPLPPRLAALLARY